MKGQGPSRRRFMLTLGFAGFGSVIPRVSRDSTIRQQILSLLDPVVEEYGHYSAYELNQAEFIGSINRPHDEIDLRDQGYHPHHLAAAKYHPVTGELDESSWRKIDPDAQRWQWHIHLWKGDAETTQVSSHYEYRPDMRLIDNETVPEMRERIQNHYEPKWNITHGAEDANYFLGKTCGSIESILS